MSHISSTDLALLSFLGVNGRAFPHLRGETDLRKLLESSSLRARKILSDDELAGKQETAERYRQPLLEFEKRGGVIVGQGGAHELGSLMRAPLPPLCAYVRGDRSLLCAPTKVAIVGTRQPSQRGVARAVELAAALSKAGILVVSGGAMGIDLAAHKGAIESGSPTLAILGEVLKPQADERPQRLLAIDKNKLLTTLTLFGPWVRPAKSLFVVRNQYVAAVADAVVIIEGRPNSGTLHTARYANQMQVPVWVVPGDPSDEMSQAGNWLLEQGLARALVRVEYFLSTLQPHKGRARMQPEQMPLIGALAQKPEKKVELSAAQEAMVQLFKANQGRMTVDELAEKCEASMSALQQELLMLELLGVVKKQGTEFLIT
jgi:DNA processing protein